MIATERPSGSIFVAKTVLPPKGSPKRVITPFSAAKSTPPILNPSISPKKNGGTASTRVEREKGRAGARRSGAKHSGAERLAIFRASCVPFREYRKKSVEFAQGYDRCLGALDFCGTDSGTERLQKYRTNVCFRKDLGREPSENVNISSLMVAPVSYRC